MRKEIRKIGAVRIMKVLCIILIVFAIITLGIFIRFAITSKGKIDKFYDTEGNILQNSISEIAYLDVNGTRNGMFLRGKSVDNPVLLFISGGPGVPEYWLNEYYNNALEDYYTVCWWDYTGEGLSYDSSLSAEDLTLESLEEDAVTVTQYLLERFGKDKIYLMGHSAGTMLAINLAEDHPELYKCYYAMGQIVDNGYDRYTYGYQFMKQIFEETGNKKAIKLMNSLVSIKEDKSVVPKNPDTIGRTWEKVLLAAGCATTRDMRSDAFGIFFPQMQSKCYTFGDKINYWKGKSLLNHSPFDEVQIPLDEPKKLQIPVCFINGYYDYTCPTPLVEAMYKKIDAPKKELHIFMNSAHSPLWEENEKVLSVMMEFN
jgi:pimeloyl-ACP methyl ester carboxylesterase